MPNQRNHDIAIRFEEHKKKQKKLEIIDYNIRLKKLGDNHYRIIYPDFTIEDVTKTLEETKEYAQNTWKERWILGDVAQY